MKKVIIILALIITTLPGSSQIHYVSHDIPGDYPTIVSAMDAAGMNDTIIMRPGTYSEFLVVPDKGLTFASMYILEPDTSYIRQTVLDGENRLGLFFMEMLNNPVDIIGLTMIRGAGSKPDYLYLGGIGGAIDCFYCDSLSVKSCHITQCRVVIGGAICCTNTKLFLSNTSIHDNHSYLVGGGLAIPEDTHFDSLNLCSVYNVSLRA